MTANEPINRDMAPGVREVVVPLDGSAFGRRAGGPGVALAGAFDAALTLVHVVPSADDTGDAAFTDVDLPAGTPVDRRVLVGEDAGLAVGEYAGQAEGALVCMSSHGRGWPSSALMGSAAAVVLASTDQPLVLVGPACLEGWVAPGRLTACLDGEAGSLAMLPVARAWSAALGVPLTLVTVAEPAPPPMRPGHARRHHGPAGDPEEYVERLVRETAGVGGQPGPVSGEVIWDPVGVTDGLTRWLGDEPAGLVVVSSHGRRPRADTPMGNTALHIVHRSPVPVLVVPFLEAAEDS